MKGDSGSEGRLGGARPDLDVRIPPGLAGERLDRVLAELAGLSRREARRAIEAGAVWLGGRRCRQQSTPVGGGESLALGHRGGDRAAIGQGGLDVVDAGPGYLVVSKPAGLPTQPPPGGGDALSRRVRDYLAARALTSRLGEVHRLDRDASGLVIYGLAAPVTARLAEAFRERQAHRAYLAVVRTAVAPEQGVIAEPVAEIAPGRMALAATGLPALSVVRPLAFDPQARLALVAVGLGTGRTHQVRLHLSWAVGAIVGDNLYGDHVPHRGRIALHGALLTVPDLQADDPKSWYREPEADFWAALGPANLVLPADAEEQLREVARAAVEAVSAPPPAGPRRRPSSRGGRGKPGSNPGACSGT